MTVGLEQMLICRVERILRLGENLDQCIRIKIAIADMGCQEEASPTTFHKVAYPFNLVIIDRCSILNVEYPCDHRKIAEGEGSGMKYEKAKITIVRFGKEEFMVMSANALGGVYCEEFSGTHCTRVWSYNTTSRVWDKHSSGNWVSDSAVDPTKGHWSFF